MRLLPESPKTMDPEPETASEDPVKSTLADVVPAALPARIVPFSVMPPWISTVALLVCDKSSVPANVTPLSVRVEFRPINAVPLAVLMVPPSMVAFV